MLPAMSAAVTGEADMPETIKCCAQVMSSGQLHSALESFAWPTQTHAWR